MLSDMADCIDREGWNEDKLVHKINLLHGCEGILGVIDEQLEELPDVLEDVARGKCEIS